MNFVPRGALEFQRLEPGEEFWDGGGRTMGPFSQSLHKINLAFPYKASLRCPSALFG